MTAAHRKFDDHGVCLYGVCSPSGLPSHVLCNVPSNVLYYVPCTYFNAKNTGEKPRSLRTAAYRAIDVHRRPAPGTCGTGVGHEGTSADTRPRPRALASGSSARKASDHHTTIPFFVAQPSASAINSASSSSTEAALNANNFHPGLMLCSFVAYRGVASCWIEHRRARRALQFLPTTSLSSINLSATYLSLTTSAGLPCWHKPCYHRSPARPCTTLLASKSAPASAMRRDRCSRPATLSDHSFVAPTAQSGLPLSWRAAQLSGGSIINAACGSWLRPSASSKKSIDPDICRTLQTHGGRQRGGHPLGLTKARAIRISGSAA